MSGFNNLLISTRYSPFLNSLIMSSAPIKSAEPFIIVTLEKAVDR